MKRLLAAMTAALLMVSLVSGATVASAPTTDLMTQSWKVYNGKPATKSFWDINKVKLTAPPSTGCGLTGTTGTLTFPVQQFLSKTTGSFAIYLLNNYNSDLTGQNFCANLSWTPGAYETRSTVFPGAYVRFEFQDVAAGRYNSNDYWWAPVGLDLNAASSGSLLASLADRSQWINQSGKSATDTTPNWVEWQGDTVAMSPYDGFTKAMKNVKQLGLSFGSSGSYASGVALDGSVGTFTVLGFTVGQ